MKKFIYNYTLFHKTVFFIKFLVKEYDFSEKYKKILIQILGIYNSF